MEQSPWSVVRTFFVLGGAVAIIVYALLGSSNDFSCSRNAYGGRDCTLGRNFIFQNDPMSGLFDHFTFTWRDPASGQNSYTITFITRPGKTAIPAIGGDWQGFLRDQAESLRTFSWGYLWNMLIYSRNILLTLATFFAISWVAVLYSFLLGQKYK